jgi:alkylation response protein AidB-like acyl-CoA dehydrogenase
MSIAAGLCFEPSEEESLAVDSFRGFADEVLKPRLDKQREAPISREEISLLLKEINAFGFPGGPIDEAHGGAGLKWTSYCLLFEELARASGAVAITVLIQTLVAAFLSTKAPPVIRDRYLPGVLAGDLIGAVAISEPDVGSNVAEIRCRAVRDGDQYRITGEKAWISNGDYSDFTICVARVGPLPADLALFLVDRGTHAYRSCNIPKLGLKATSTAQLYFDEACVPASHRLTEDNDGLRNVMSLFEIARPLVGAISVGIARAALDLSVSYATQRRQHGKVIAEHQLIQAMLAEMSTEIDAARLLVLRALDTIDRGRRAEEQSAKGKWYATEMAVRVTSKAIDIHGGNGISSEFPIEELFRNARMMTIPDGTTSIQKLIIGRCITGKRAF